jgi:nicotinamide-nucleotide amidase
LTEPPGSSANFAGGVVAYSNEAKVSLVGVDAALIEQFGAVSEPVAEALADGAVRRFEADFGIGITGIAGPDGGTDEKPVGTVCVSVSSAGDHRITLRTRLPGDRADVRDRATTVALHLLRRLLLEDSSPTSDPVEPRAADAR